MVYCSRVKQMIYRFSLLKIRVIPLYTKCLVFQAREAFAALSMQVTEYMKMNHYHPNKAKILRIEKDWYDPDTERDDMEGTFKLSTVTSSSSLSGLVQNGMLYVI